MAKRPKLHAPIDVDLIKERRERLKALRKLLRRGDEREFMAFLRRYGIRDGTPEFREYVELFRVEAGKLD